MLVRARENPFRVERLEALAFRFPTGDGMGALLWRIGARSGRGAIVGPHGSGKTTAMLELGAHLRGEGWRVREMRIGAGRHALSPSERAQLTLGVGPNDAVLLDGAGHLWTWEWWSLRHALRGVGRFVVATHRPGRLPTVLRTRVSLALVRDLVDELEVAISDAELGERLRRVRGDARALFRGLYEDRSES